MNHERVRPVAVTLLTIVALVAGGAGTAVAQGAGADGAVAETVVAGETRAGPAVAKTVMGGPDVGEKTAETGGQIGKRDGPSPASLSVTIDGTPVPDDGSITTADTPNLSMRAVGETTIDLVAVRVDGTTVRSYAPNATTFTEATALDLTPGEHGLTIVVETTQSTRTYTATITEDSVPPVVTFTSPFSTENSSIYGEPNESYTLHSGTVRLAGTLHDHSAVERVEIDLRYNERGENSDWGYRDEITIEDPGSSFSRTLRLGPRTHPLGTGTNQLEVTLEDSFGQVRWYEVDLYVRDDETPEISILDRKAVKERSAVKLTARADDRVGLYSVGSRIGPEDGTGLKYALPPTPVPNRPHNVTFTRTIPVTQGSEVITINASDGNQTTTRKFAVNYTELVTPKFDFAEEDIRAVRDDRLHVTGLVYDGSISRVYVETVAPDGDIVDINQVHGGAITDTVQIDETLRMNVYPATVRIRAIDVRGVEHLSSIEVSQSDVTSDEFTTGGTPTGPSTTTDTRVTSVESGPPITPTNGDGGGVIASVTRFVRETLLSPFSTLTAPAPGV